LVLESEVHVREVQLLSDVVAFEELRLEGCIIDVLVDDARSQALGRWILLRLPHVVPQAAY